MNSLAELRSKRQQYVELARSNNFEDGLRNLLADLYPDNAHFVFELLQNAEDSGATEVSFDLREDRLLFHHNGTRDFTLPDIDSITGIGNSTKAGDATKIGKFGVGFKAVFAYTATPHISSGDYSFRIRHLFVPEETDQPSRPGRTEFVFPFDQKSKPPANAVQEIRSQLQQLGHETLLFLTNIAALTYVLCDGERGSLKRVELEDGILEISTTRATSQLEGAVRRSHWLRLQGVAKAIGANGPGRFPVAAAFAIERHSRDVTLGSNALDSFSVVPVPRGQVSIFFPAGNEYSGLRFHIHAPFASTVARDAVRDTPENDELIAGITLMLVKALPRLRDQGFIRRGLLAALPNDADPLGNKYRPLRDALVTAFRKSQLCPVADSPGHAPAAELVDGPTVVREAFKSRDLTFWQSIELGTASGRPRWMEPSTGRAHQFLRSAGPHVLDAQQIGDGLVGFAKAFRNPHRKGNDLVAQGWQEWIEGVSTAQLRRIYVMLASVARASATAAKVLPDIPLIRTSIGHRPGRTAYLPPARTDERDDFVLADLLPAVRSEKLALESAELTTFYEMCQVVRWDPDAAAVRRAEEYARFSVPLSLPVEEHLADVRAFMDLARRDSARMKQLADTPFLRALAGDTLNGAREWTGHLDFLGYRPPSELRIGAPYVANGLEVIPDYEGMGTGLRSRLLDSVYEPLGDAFITFVQGLGGIVAFSVVKHDVEDNPDFSRQWASKAQGGKRAQSHDWWMPGLEAASKSADMNALRTLWEAVCASHASAYSAFYQYNKANPGHALQSTFAHQLANNAWVLGSDNKVHRPQEVMVRDLHPSLAIPENEAVLRRLGLRASTSTDRGSADDEANDEQLARVMHVSLEVAGRVASIVSRIADLDDDRQLETLEVLENELAAKRAIADFAPNAPDPDRRSARVGERAESAVPHSTVRRESSVTEGQGELRAEAKAYLRGHYTDPDSGHLVCQICQHLMPFQFKGEDYFDAVLCVRRRQKDHIQNHLALCPVCAAKYRHARETDDEEMAARIREIDVSPDHRAVELSVVLAEEPHLLHFAAKHALDIRAVLTRAGEQRDARD